MFYQDHEKTIYSPPSTELKYDPLAVHRKLLTATGNKFDELWAAWCGADSDLGDVSIPRDQRVLESLDAEGKLAHAARAAFDLKPFPDTLDATALEYLRDFVRWMEGKGQRVTPT